MSNNIDIDQIKKERNRDVRIMNEKAQARIQNLALPTIVLLQALLVGSIVYIEDAAMIAIIASSTSSISMALISILASFAGADKKDDPVIEFIKMLEKQNTALLEIVNIEKSKSTEMVLDDKAIKVVDGDIKAVVSSDILYGKDKKLKK
tara:strand:+ start:346 stop:792 length:447 start_codon:yes stop_codon:yes gene_type:complete